MLTIVNNLPEQNTQIPSNMERQRQARRLRYTKEEMHAECLRQLFKTYEHRAEQKNVRFALSLRQFEKQIFGDCFYCGRHPTNAFLGAKKVSLLDRVDVTKGFVPRNVVACCGICNNIKTYYTIERLEKISKIYKRVSKFLRMKKGSRRG